MVQNIASPLEWQMNFAVNWSKVNCILKSQTLTFWSNSSAKNHNSSNMSKYETYSSINQKVKISFGKVKISKLRNFSKCWKSMFFHNFVLIFHHDARWLWKNFQHESCRSPWYIKHLFIQLLLKVLISQVISS